MNESIERSLENGQQQYENAIRALELTIEELQRTFTNHENDPVLQGVLDGLALLKEDEACDEDELARLFEALEAHTDGTLYCNFRDFLEEKAGRIVRNHNLNMVRSAAAALIMGEIEASVILDSWRERVFSKAHKIIEDVLDPNHSHPHDEIDDQALLDNITRYPNLATIKDRSELGGGAAADDDAADDYDPLEALDMDDDSFFAALAMPDEEQQGAAGRAILAVRAAIRNRQTPAHSESQIRIEEAREISLPLPVPQENSAPTARENAAA